MYLSPLLNLLPLDLHFALKCNFKWRASSGSHTGVCRQYYWRKRRVHIGRSRSLTNKRITQIFSWNSVCCDLLSAVQLVILFWKVMPALFSFNMLLQYLAAIIISYRHLRNILEIYVHSTSHFRCAQKSHEKSYCNAKRISLSKISRQTSYIVVAIRVILN